MTAVIATVAVGLGPADLAVSPDGLRVYVTNFTDNTVSVIDATTNTVTATIPIGPLSNLANLGPSGVVVTPDNTRVYVARNDTVAVIDTATNTVSTTIEHSIGTGAVAMSRDGLRLYVSAQLPEPGESGVLVMDTDPNSATYHEFVAAVPLSPTGYFNSITVSERFVLVTDTTNATLCVIDIDTNSVVSTLPAVVATQPNDVAVAYPDGPWLTRIYLLLADENKVIVFDETGQSANPIDWELTRIDGHLENTVIEVGDAPVAATASPNGTRVYVANADGNTVSVIDSSPTSATYNHVIATIPVGEGPSGVAVSPDNTRVYVANGSSDTVSVINAADPWHPPDLIGRLLGGADRDGGGWLVIGNTFIPIPPRSPFLSVVARVAAPHLDQAIENAELGEQFRRALQSRYR